MSNIKKLAGQTIWYGMSSIFGRFLNYLLTPVLTLIYGSSQYGDISILFALAAFLNIIFTYGMETAYFRFNKDNPEQMVFNTGQTLLLSTTILFTALLWLPIPEIAGWMKMEDHPEYLSWVLWIVALDTISVLPFSRLRYEGRPIRFATIKILSILLNIGLVIFFLVLCKGEYDKGAGNIWSVLYDPKIDIGYVFLANLAASAFTVLMLSKEFFGFRPKIDWPLLRNMAIYSAPLLVVGFGGMINETIDRFMIVNHFAGTVEQAKSANGIYSANYKLAVLIVLFIQAFRMGAEPFFFRQASEPNAPKTYARIMKFFVITCCICFLAVTLFLDIWKHFMGIRNHPEYLQGLMIVPVLMLAKIFLGVYYNLSIWYKLTNKTMTGAYITIAGALITILMNYIFIPIAGFIACAWATFFCYGFMMVASYRLGQKHFRIPYAWKKLTAYIVISVLLFLLHQLFRSYAPNLWWTHAFGVFELLTFMLFVGKIEKKELVGIPLLTKLFR